MHEPWWGRPHEGPKVIAFTITIKALLLRPCSNSYGVCFVGGGGFPQHSAVPLAAAPGRCFAPRPSQRDMYTSEPPSVSPDSLKKIKSKKHQPHQPPLLTTAHATAGSALPQVPCHPLAAGWRVAPTCLPP